MAETMIERDGGDPDEIRQGEGMAAGRSWTGWQAYASDAKDILAAMREPTEAMIKAGVHSGGWSDWYEDEGEFRAPAAEAFTAMIDAALAEA